LKCASITRLRWVPTKKELTMADKTHAFNYTPFKSNE